MNKLQKIILSLYAAVILVMFLIPPYQRHSTTRLEDMGHLFIWESHFNKGTVNVQLLGIQMLVASLVAAALWLLTKDGNPLAGWSAPKGFSARKTQRTALAFVVCFILFFVYILGGGMLFQWKHGGGAIPMAIASSIIFAVWRAIRGSGSESGTEQTSVSSAPAIQSTKTQSFATSAPPSTPAIKPLPSSARPKPSSPLLAVTEPAELSAFEMLAKEKETGFRHEALWLKCFSEAEGDQARAEAAYNRERASTLALQAVAEKDAALAKDTARLMAWRAEISRHMAKLEKLLDAVPPRKAAEAVHVQVGNRAEMETVKSTLPQALAEFQAAAKKLHSEIQPSEWEGGHLKQPLAAAVKGDTPASLPWFVCLALVNQGETWKQLIMRVQDAIHRLDGWLLLHAAHAQILSDADVAISEKKSAKTITALYEKLKVVKFADLNYKKLEGFILAREGRSAKLLLGAFCLIIAGITGFGVYRAQTAKADAAATRMAKEHADAEAARFAKEHADAEAVRMAKEKADAEAARLAKEKEKNTVDAYFDRLQKQDAEAARLANEKADAETARMAKEKADAETTRMAKDNAAIRDLIALAQSGYAEAQAELAHRYAVGSGVDRDQTEAANWNLKAAMQGNSRAQSNLGVNYGNGQGVPRDNIEAYAWWLLAAQAGSTHARTNLKKYENFLTSEQKQRAKNRAAELAREIR